MIPNLVETAQRVIDEKTVRAVDRQTGVPVDEGQTSLEKAILLDMQTASVIVDSYDRLEDKSKFDAALKKVGAVSLIHRLWELYSK